VKQTIEVAAKDRKNFEYECRLVMPDASAKYVRVVAHALAWESSPPPWRTRSTSRLRRQLPDEPHHEQHRRHEWLLK
jgi:hypothetical protein